MSKGSLKLTRIKRLLVWLTVIIIGLPVILALANVKDQPVNSSHKVFIAFGFHVNLYHSFRNDTNDDSGFGKDIRVIRHIIRTLDRYNEKGVPVKGIWDFDNLFSLQEILPRYAPDIIENIRRRVHENGDEVILMSYNNGLVSAMTEDELNNAVKWSISNPWQSGVEDLFGKFSPIVRPQEMMTTPGNFSIYKKYGVKAVSLYYSATPFDTFRVFSRPLNWTEGHNPMMYHHPKTKEEMVIIPTYHFGDLMEHVSLKHWVAELKERQEKGILKQDALISINFDADSELWEGIDLPWTMEWLPNTGGIGALVREVADLPNVVFTTLGEYLAEHPPVGSFSFSQDTADGSFNGYNSWAEKADSSRYWTSIERNRHTCEAARKAMRILPEALPTTQLENLLTFAEMMRLRALSTTNFGMATPFLARQREQVMDGIVANLDNYSDQLERLMTAGLQSHLRQYPSQIKDNTDFKLLDTIMVLQPGKQTQLKGNRFVKLNDFDMYQPYKHFALIRSDGKVIPTTNFKVKKEQGKTRQLTLFVADGGLLTDGIYQLCAADAAKIPSSTQLSSDIYADHTGISNGRLSLQFKNNQVEGIYLDGIRKVRAGSLMPYLKWGNKTFCAKGGIQSETIDINNQSLSIQVSGPFSGPADQTLSAGWMDYRFTMLKDQPYLIVQGKVKYPSTEKQDIFKAASPGLMRRMDMNWREVAPAEIRFAPVTTKSDPVRVVKQNYLNITTEYTLDYFNHSDRNLRLDNINNHITASYVGVIAGDQGMAIAKDASIQSNFAFAPLKLDFDNHKHTFSIRANPFGTYCGRQYTPSTWGNGLGFDATLLAGEQYASAGPTFNDYDQQFSMMFAFFNAQKLPEKIKQDLEGYALPPMVISSSRQKTALKNSIEQPLSVPQGLIAAYRNGRIQFSWDGDGYPENHYRISCGSRSGHYDVVYPAVGNSLSVTRCSEHFSFTHGRQYYAVIEKIAANGRTSKSSAEIQFTINNVKKTRPHVPLTLELKVLWANLHVLLNSLYM